MQHYGLKNGVLVAQRDSPSAGHLCCGSGTAPVVTKEKMRLIHFYFTSPSPVMYVMAKERIGNTLLSLKLRDELALIRGIFQNFKVWFSISFWHWIYQAKWQSSAT